MSLRFTSVLQSGICVALLSYYKRSFQFRNIERPSKITDQRFDRWQISSRLGTSRSRLSRTCNPQNATDNG